MKLKHLALALATGLATTFGAQAATVAISNTTPVAICDLCTVTSTITVNQHLMLSDVNVSVFDLRHTWDSDLLIQILSPQGTAVTLSQRRGGSGDNYINTVFDDQAALPIPTGAAPFTGSFRPDGQLSVFNGTDAFGTWTLRVADQVAADAGTLNRWGLTLTGTTNTVPEPASLALLGAAFVGLGIARRRKA